MAPSMRVVLPLAELPFTFTIMDRDGLPPIELFSLTSAAPGINV